jgi:hypothetical protein
MNFIHTIYYYYFLFYKKILKDNEPHLLTTLALSASFGFVLDFIARVILANTLCISLNTWLSMVLLGLVVLIVYYIFHKSGIAKEVVKQKPMFFNNHIFSIIISILFFIMTVSFMFWGPTYTKEILDNCR